MPACRLSIRTLSGSSTSATSTQGNYSNVDEINDYADIVSGADKTSTERSPFLEIELDRLSHPRFLTEADAVASARSIPLDLSLRIEFCIEWFANRYDSFLRSQSTINRRVQEAADQADLTGRIYPHCLRATTANHHAYKGVAPVPFQALMDWSDLATAQKYIRISGTATADILRRVHHR